MTTEQKQRLLYTSERLNRSGIQLDNTYRIAVETEEIGSQILTDLNRQRETMQNSFNRVSIFYIYCLQLKLTLINICIVAQRCKCRPR